MLTLVINTEFHILLTNADNFTENIYTLIAGLFAKDKISGSFIKMIRSI